MNSKKVTFGLLIFYIIALVWIVLFKFQFSLGQLDHFRSVNLIPFAGSDIVYNSECASWGEANQKTDIISDSSFQSTDGSVSFHFITNSVKLPESMPIVEVVPYYLNEEDVRAVANALFDENDAYYEARINSNRIYSRSELLEQINRWSQYTQEQSVISLYGENRGNITEKVKRAIERNTILCESAPEEDVRLPARWTFQKDSFYYLTDEERSTHDFSVDNDAIMLEVTHKDLPYLLSVAKRNRTDYKISNVSAYLNEGSAPRQLDSRIFHAQLCRTNEPDAQQIELIKTKAQSILDSINLGQWKIDHYFVEEQHYGECSEYIIHIDAVPVFSGVSACRRPQIDNLKSKEVYSSNYYITDVHFEFSANGDMLYFNLCSPVEAKKVVESNAPILNYDTLLAKARNMLELSDIHNYDSFGISDGQENIACAVEISDVSYGLNRINIPNSDESYLYVPSVVFSGTISIYEKNGNNVYFIEKNVHLLALNATDGSVIRYA